MKITAYLVTYGRPVGADRMSQVILRRLAAEGHDVRVWADVQGGSYEDEGVRVKPRAFMPPLESPGDLIYAHADYGSLPILKARQHGGIPVVYTAHNTSPSTEHHLANFPPSRILWNSESTAERLRGWLLHAPAPVQESLLRPPLQVPARKAPRGDAVTLVNVCQDKGSDVFYALAEALPETPFLGVRGGYGDQDVRDLPNVTLIDPVPADRMRAEVWARTAVLLTPSRFESWGMAACEALAHGVPVVSAPVPGLIESLGDAGSFVPADDLTGWQDRVAGLLADRAAYRAASEAGRARAREVAALHAADLDAFVSTVAA